VTVIDFHTHVFPPEVIARRDAYLQRDPWFGLLYANPKARMASAEDLVASMGRSGVDAAVTFGFAWADPGLCREANDYVIESAARWPGRLYGFAVANPARAGAVAEIERCLGKGLHGVGELMPDGQGYSLGDRRLDEVVRQAGQGQHPVLIHAGEPVGHGYAGKSRCTLQPFYQLALRHPQATLVAAHWGGGLFFYELMPEVREALRNVCYDTAASPYLYHDDVFAVAARIAPHKVLFGTDYPLIGHGPFLRRVRQSGLEARSLELLLGDNARRLLRCGVQTGGQ